MGTIRRVVISKLSDAMAENDFGRLRIWMVKIKLNLRGEVNLVKGWCVLSSIVVPLYRGREEVLM